MQTFVILVSAAAIAAAVVWWSSAPPAERVHRPRVPRRTRARRRAVGSGGRPFTIAAPPSPPQVSAPAPPRPTEPGPAPEPTQTLVLEPSTLPDERPSRVLALLRLVFTIAVVAALSVAILAALWLVVNGQLAGYLAR